MNKEATRVASQKLRVSLPFLSLVQIGFLVSTLVSLLVGIEFCSDRLSVPEGEGCRSEEECIVLGRGLVSVETSRVFV